MNNKPKLESPLIVKEVEEKLHLRTYIFGYGMSLIFTLTAYLMVYHHSASTPVLIGLVVVLALAQFFVQMYYFLHLGSETKPRWKLYVAAFMITIVLIIVFGSIWIINNLNTRMTIPEQIQYMNSQNAL